MKNEYNILLIEDNEGDAELTKEALRENATNARIRVIDNGEEALLFLRVVRERQEGALPNLILLDMNLPKIDGREILYFVKNDDVLKRIPVVILSTSSLQNDISYSYDNHANCYIVKPVHLPDFISSIQCIEKFWINCVTYP